MARTGLIEPEEWGTVLLPTLIVLLIISFLGVYGMQASSTQENMAGYAKDRQQAFEAAESAVQGAEAFIRSTASPGFIENGTGLLAISDTDPDYSDPDMWGSGNSIQYATSQSDLSQQPRYIIKRLRPFKNTTGSQAMGGYGSQGAAPQVDMFRITAIGYGGRASTHVVVREIFGKIY